MSAAETLPVSRALPSRWAQLGLGLIAMMAISSPQYVWTLFVKPFQVSTGGTLPAIQITFSLLVVLQTWLSPFQGRRNWPPAWWPRRRSFRTRPTSRPGKC